MLNNNKVGISFLDNRYDILNYGYQNEYVTDLIRESLLSAGLGNVDINAPLKDIIESGMTVLLKPNWVHHENLSGMGRDCLITHEIFLEAVTKEVIKCLCKSIMFLKWAKNS